MQLQADRNYLRKNRRERVDVTEIIRKVLELLTIGEIDGNGVVIVEQGEYFLESVLRKFQLKFIERWKLSSFSPRFDAGSRNIFLSASKESSRSPGKILNLRQSLSSSRKNTNAKSFGERDTYKGIYLGVIKRAWEMYEKSMQDVEFVKEVHFKYNSSSEREWGEFSRNWRGN